MVASPVKAAVQDIKRLREITRVLTKHGFHALVRRIGLGGEEADRKLLGAEALAALDGPMLGEDRLEAAVRLRRVLEDLGPTFVKLGQVLSTRPDIIPAEFIAEFRHLQARVEPMPLEDVVSQIERALGATVDDVFETFEAHPLGSASIGQVHAATLPGGQRCVVKVQRPNIGEKIRSDLDILYSLAKLLEATIEEVELYSPTGIVKEFSGALFKELDFEQEAKSMREFARNFADSEGIEAPAVHEELTTDTILTMEFVDAKPLSEIEGGTPRASMLLDRLLDATVEMVLYDGFYHADPHPGNIFVRDDDTLVYIDFGMVGRLSVGQQDEVINLIIAVLTGDVDGISRTLLRMGRPIGRVGLREFKADIVRIRDKYLLANLSEINVTQFIQEVMDAAQYHRIQLNTAYAVLVKTAMTIEGIMRELEPELDLPARATPYVRQLAARRFT
ncbi:MAG: AarF/ABC1/UbiB kinase family protein, partial [Myxococcota bacterium]